MKKHPFVVWSSVICLSLCVTLISSAQDEAKKSRKAEVDQDLYKKVLGYWVLDLDSPEMKAFVASMGDGKEPVPPE